MLDRADIGEMLIIALAARDAGFTRVEVMPESVIEIIERLLALEDVLASTAGKAGA